MYLLMGPALGGRDEQLDGGGVVTPAAGIKGFQIGVGQGSAHLGRARQGKGGEVVHGPDSRRRH
jgi:hypothetical protein